MQRCMWENEKLFTARLEVHRIGRKNQNTSTHTSAWAPLHELMAEKQKYRNSDLFRFFSTFSSAFINGVFI